MKSEMNCPLCNDEIYSGLGEGCKMCGMSLEDKSEEFCSASCKDRYKKINT